MPQVIGYDYKSEVEYERDTHDKLNSINDEGMNYLKNRIFLDNKKNDKKNDNEFMNLTIEDIYNNIINLIPNLYNEYNKIYLEVSLNLKSENEFTPENVIIKNSLIKLLFNSKNILYVGIVIIFICILLYIIN